MPTIFDGVRKMTDDEIRMQIALLRNVTMMNVAKETGNKLLGGLADIANAFTEAFSNKTPFNYQAEKVSDMVKNGIKELAAKDRVQLEFELKKCLTDKCADLAEGDRESEQKDDVSEERLSFIICNEAAKAYASIQKYESPANKIDNVSIQYNKNFLASLHGMLVSQSAREVTETDKKIQQRLNEVSMETKRSLQKALMPKEFSGYGIGRILRLERSTKYLEFTVTYLGVDCFDVVSVNAATAFSAVRNLKRVSRILLAQFVWRARMAYGVNYAMDLQMLPSYISMNDYKAHMDEEKEFRAAISGRVEAEKRLDEIETELNKINDQIVEAEDKLELDQREYDEAQMEFMGLESRKDDYIAGKRPEDETKKFYSSVNETKREIDRAQADLSKKRSKLRELSLKLDKKESERNTARLNCEVLRQKTDIKVTERTQRLRSKWRAFFFRFEFEEELYEKVVLNFLDSEILSIEEMLKELHDSADTASFRYRTAPVNIEEHTEIHDAGLDAAHDAELDTAQDSERPAESEQIGYRSTYCRCSSGKNAEIQYMDRHILKISAVR